jgi:hypothetical protein
VPDWTQFVSPSLHDVGDIKLVENYSTTSWRRRRTNGGEDSGDPDLVLLDIFGYWQFGIKFPSFSLGSQPATPLPRSVLEKLSCP